MTYSQAQLDLLIRCDKKIVTPPKQNMVEVKGHRKNDMKLASKEGKDKFRAYIRQNIDFSENFSVGLTYIPEDGSGEIQFLRLNGPHEGPPGEGKIDGEDPRHHSGYHMHMARAENIESGFKAEKYVEKTKEYADLRSALRFFLKTCNIQGAEAYFVEILEETLFD